MGIQEQSELLRNKHTQRHKLEHQVELNNYCSKFVTYSIVYVIEKGGVRW